MNIQIRENFFTAGAHAIKKIKVFRSCSSLKTYLSCVVLPKLSAFWSQLNNELYFVVIFYSIFFQQFKYLSNDLEQFYSSSSSSSEKIFF